MTTQPPDKPPDKLPVTASWRQRMVDAMRIQGITQATIGDRLGVDQTAISLISSGKTRSSDLVPGICAILHIPPPAVIVEDDDMVRWYEAGSVLHRKHPRIFERHLRNALEAIDDYAVETERLGRDLKPHQ
jgi:transcriptional regulator with XRE-family HTH domain